MTTKSRAGRIFAVGALAVLASAWPAFPASPAAPLVDVRIVTDEADAALAVPGERRETGAVKPASWDRL